MHARITVNGPPRALPARRATVADLDPRAARSTASGSPSRRTARSCRAAATPNRRSPRATGSRSSPPSAAAERIGLTDMAQPNPMNAPHAPTAALADPLLDRRPRLPLAPAGRHRQVPRFRARPARRSSRRAREIVTVAIRRTNIGQDPNAPSLLDALPPSEFTYLPNTAGCYTADDAVRTLRLARELLDGHTLVKLEVLGDPHDAVPERARDAQGRRDAGQGRLPGDGVHVRRSDHRARARGDRLRGDHAARVADRLGDGHPQPVEPEADHRRGEGAGAGRRRRRHRVGRRDRDGAGLRRRADEHGDRAGAATRCGWRAR